MLSASPRKHFPSQIYREAEETLVCKTARTLNSNTNQTTWCGSPEEERCRKFGLVHKVHRRSTAHQQMYNYAPLQCRIPIRMQLARSVPLGPPKPKSYQIQAQTIRARSKLSPTVPAINSHIHKPSLHNEALCNWMERSACSPKFLLHLHVNDVNWLLPHTSSFAHPWHVGEQGSQICHGITKMLYSRIHTRRQSPMLPHQPWHKFAVLLKWHLILNLTRSVALFPIPHLHRFDADYTKQQQIARELLQSSDAAFYSTYTRSLQMKRCAKERPMTGDQMRVSCPTLNTSAVRI